MKFLFGIFLGLTLIFSLFPGVSSALEEGHCLCYCKTPEGADYVGEKAGVDLCSASCRKEEVRMLGCYSDVSRTPEFSRICYTKAECESDTETNAKGEELPSVWSGQKDTCLPGRGHCYSPLGAGDYAVKLSVPIAGMTEVGDLGTYIVAIYRWLIGLGAFICVVVFTIAGLMWLLSGGNAGTVERAKEMMTKAILGMVLILSAVAIGTLIDPRTMEIGALRTPKLAPVTLVSDDCSEWIRLGVEVGQISGSGQCGDTGIAVSTEAIPKNAGVTVKVNDICKFKHCKDAFEYCAPHPDSESGYSCQRCANQYTVPIDTTAGTVGGAVVDYANDSGYVDLHWSTQVPPEQCGLLEASARDDANRASEAGNAMYCQYYNPPDLAVGTQARGCYEITYPNTVNDYTLNCEVLRNQAQEEGGVSCRAYDQAYATSGYMREYASIYRVDDLSGANNVFPMLQRVCSDDPCGFAPPGETCAPYIMNAEVAQEVCSGTFGWLFPACAVLVTNAGRADCVNSGYLTVLESIEQSSDATRGQNTGILDTILGSGVDSITSDIAELYAKYKYLQVLDVNGNPTDYQALW